MISDLPLLIVATSLFVGGHELLSHPLRAPIVRAVGEKGFLAIYALVALGSLIWAGEIWKAMPPDRLWDAPGWAYYVALPAMLVASILFVGSMTAPNPALMGGGIPEKSTREADGVRGVQRLTRHPMMWAFALWAIVHMGLSADSRTLVLAGGILVLALFGASMQDRKKMAIPGYAAHVAKTSFVPFAAQLGGRAGLTTLWPGSVAFLGGLGLWVMLLWGHPLVMGVSALQLWR